MRQLRRSELIAVIVRLRLLDGGAYNLTRLCVVYWNSVGTFARTTRKTIKISDLGTFCACFQGFRREIDDNCVLLGYYAASSGNL